MRAGRHPRRTDQDDRLALFHVDLAEVPHERQLGDVPMLPFRTRKASARKLHFAMRAKVIAVTVSSRKLLVRAQEFPGSTPMVRPPCSRVPAGGGFHRTGITAVHETKPCCASSMPMVWLPGIHRLPGKGRDPPKTAMIRERGWLIVPFSLGCGSLAMVPIKVARRAAAEKVDDRLPDGSHELAVHALAIVQRQVERGIGHGRRHPLHFRNIGDP